MQSNMPNKWGGLEYNTGSNSVFDGSVNHGNWHYAVGVIPNSYGNGFPGPEREESLVELWVLALPEAFTTTPLIHRELVDSTTSESLFSSPIFGKIPLSRVPVEGSKEAASSGPGSGSRLVRMI